MGVEFCISINKFGHSVLGCTVCSRPEPAVLYCATEEKVRDWHFEGNLTFSPDGMVSSRHFITKGTRTKKYYKRMDAKMEEEELIEM